MKIFISWSGDLAKNIAEIFRQWIPGVIQAAKPYYSPDDITKGTKWSSEISKELDASKVGLICLTKDNLGSPWIMFEAGALSKNIEESKVVPLLFGIEPSDVEGPLVQFQAAKFSKTEMKRVIEMINFELGENRLSSDVLKEVFEMWWPKLESEILKVEKQAKNIKEEEEKAKNTQTKDSRSERDLLEEVLSLTREILINRSAGNDRGISARVYEDFISSFDNLVEAVVINNYVLLAPYLRDLQRPLEYLIERQMSNGSGLRKEVYMNYKRSVISLEENLMFAEKRYIKPRKFTTEGTDPK
jgi:hypothetical protein